LEREGADPEGESRGAVSSFLALLSVLTGLTARLLLSSSLAALLPLFLLLAAASRVSTFQLFSQGTPGFQCPGVPWLPLGGLLVNMFLISQMHPPAWLRLLLVTLCALAFYFTLERNHPRPSPHCAPQMLGCGAWSSVKGLGFAFRTHSENDLLVAGA